MEKADIEKKIQLRSKDQSHNGRFLLAKAWWDSFQITADKTDIEKALAAFSQAIELGNNSQALCKYLCERAKAYYTIGSFKEVVKDFELAQSVFNKTNYTDILTETNTHNQLQALAKLDCIQNSLLNQQKPQQMDNQIIKSAKKAYVIDAENQIKTCDEKIQADSGNYFAHYLKAEALMNIERYPEAIESCSKAIELMDNKKCLALRAKLYYLTHQVDKARADVETIYNTSNDNTIDLDQCVVNDVLVELADFDNIAKQKELQEKYIADSSNDEMKELYALILLSQAQSDCSNELIGSDIDCLNQYHQFINSADHEKH